MGNARVFPFAGSHLRSLLWARQWGLRDEGSGTRPGL
jgi:hypothetical protein